MHRHIILAIFLFEFFHSAIGAQDCFQLNADKSQVVLNPPPAVGFPGIGKILTIPCTIKIINFKLAIDFLSGTEKYFEDSTQLAGSLHHNGFTYILKYDPAENVFEIPDNQNNLGAGKYSFTISSSGCAPGGQPCSNCMPAFSFDVVYNTNINLNVSITTDPVPPVLECHPGSEVKLFGAQAPNNNFTVQWSYLTDNQFVPIPGATDKVFIADKAGVYRYTMTGPAACSASNIVTVHQPEHPVIVFIPETQALNACAQAITGVQLSNDGGGGTNLVFAWMASNNGVIKSGENTRNPVISAPGTYSLSVLRKDNGCSSSASLTVVPGSVPVVNVQMVPTPNTFQLDCLVKDIILKASPTVSSGSPDFSYLWFDGSTDNKKTVNAPGQYSVTVTALISGCQGASTATVTQDLSLPIVAMESARDTICVGESTTLTVLTQEPTNYLWSDDSDLNTLNVQPASEGNHAYTVTVTAKDNGCSNSETVWIHSVPVPVIWCSDQTITVSDGEPVTLHCSVNDGGFIWSASFVNIRDFAPSGSGPLQDLVFLLTQPQAPGLAQLNLYGKNAGCTGDRMEFTIKVLPDTEKGIYIPELLTPNGDGINDSWDIVIPESFGKPEDFTLMLFNRHGSLVYKENLAAAFDPNQYPDGAYFYVLQWAGGENIKGAVTILHRQ